MYFFGLPAQQEWFSEIRIFSILNFLFLRREFTDRTLMKRHVRRVHFKPQVAFKRKEKIKQRIQQDHSLEIVSMFVLSNNRRKISLTNKIGSESTFL